MDGRRLVAAALLACAALVSVARAGTHAQLTVYAAASLTDVLPRIDPSERYSFAGSNTLAAQIEQGAPADVFASANTTLPSRLHAKGLCSKPVVFTRNALVIVVPRANRAGIRTVDDLTRRGVKLVVAASGVPVGSYTLQVLRNLHLASPVLANVVSRETDAKTVPGRVKAIRLPARAQPNVRYGICLVTSSSHTAEGRAFVKRLLSRGGQARLVAAGFLPRLTPAARK
jgi:molybdate transport system substrate-binding protein